jgi:CrcB protein
VHLAVQIALVTLGAAVGGVARWGVTVAAARRLGAGFPWGTFVINVSGCLFLGWFNAFWADRLSPSGTGVGWLQPDDLKLLIATGFTGAYTTFSTFEYESDQMLRRGDGFPGALYLFGSMAVGLSAARLGAFLAHWL